MNDFMVIYACILLASYREPNRFEPTYLIDTPERYSDDLFYCRVGDNIVLYEFDNDVLYLIDNVLFREKFSTRESSSIVIKQLNGLTDDVRRIVIKPYNTSSEFIDACEKAVSELVEKY